MSAHSTLFAATGLAAMFAQHADSGRVRYTSSVGVQLAVDAIVGAERAAEATRDGEMSNQREREIVLLEDDIEKPRLNATVTVDGVDYSVRHVAGPEGGLWHVTLTRNAQSEATRPGYRRDIAYGR